MDNIGRRHGPDFTTNVYQSWEDLLCQFAYKFVYTDGLNRFYLAEEHYDSLSPAFRCPPNVYDNWVRASEVAANERAGLAERLCAEMFTHHENAKRRIEPWRQRSPYSSSLAGASSLPCGRCSNNAQLGFYWLCFQRLCTVIKSG